MTPRFSALSSKARACWRPAITRRRRASFARSWTELFHLKRYGESRAIFKEVQLEPDIPWQVRHSIDRFMQNIDDILGYVRFSVSVVSDSNPRNITSQREFTLSGVRLTFQPPEDYKTVTGLRLGCRRISPSCRKAGWLDTSPARTSTTRGPGWTGLR